MKTAIVILSLISAITFASIFAKPAADPNHAPKAWAHGVGYVPPRTIGTLSFATASLVLVGIEGKRRGARHTFRHPATIVALLLLLPALYTLVLLIRVMIAATT